MIRSKVGLYPIRAQTAFYLFGLKVYQNPLKQMRKSLGCRSFLFGKPTRP